MQNMILNKQDLYIVFIWLNVRIEVIMCGCFYSKSEFDVKRT